MKGLIIAALLCITCAGAALADEPVSDTEMCDAIGQLAASVMDFRQSGKPMSVLVGIADRTEAKDKAAADAMHALVSMAYDEPQWYTEETRADAVARFRNKVEVLCFSERSN